MPFDEQEGQLIYTRDTYKRCSRLDSSSEAMTGISVKGKWARCIVAAEDAQDEWK
jgi:hypothetical protein